MFSLVLKNQDIILSSLNNVTDICQKELQSENNSTKEMLIRGSFFIIAIISIVSLLTISQTIRSNEKLQQHPAKLIYTICLLEACFTWNAYF